MSPEDAPAAVFSPAIDIDQRLDVIDVTWHSTALVSVNEVDIVVYGYRESNGQFEFSGPEIVLAKNVDYQLGSLSDITGYTADDLDLDIGVIGGS